MDLAHHCLPGGLPLPGRRWHRLLLNMPIARRLALGFLVPALLAIIALGSIALQSQQLLTHESSFYRSLVGGYSELTTSVDILQQVHTVLLGTLNDAGKPQTVPQTLQEDRTTMQVLTGHLATTLLEYQRQDVFHRYADLVTLFMHAGHASQVEQQQTLASADWDAWLAYRTAQQRVLDALKAGHLSTAQVLELGRVEPAYAVTMGNLLRLLQFTAGLVPSIHDALIVEENHLLLVTVLAGLSILLGIGIVGWLVFSTLVRRLQQARQIVQVIEGGSMNVRLPAIGRDEITSVSGAVNGMLDTIVGLLEETQRQRDELANAEELKRLHHELERKHEALNEANARLEALATMDPLTGLPNHRCLMNRIEEELSRSQRTGEQCALLFIDLDHFKHINDTWGHRAGDAVLYEVGRRLAQALRVEDFVGRYGGEEFAIVLVNIMLEEARGVAERLRMALAEAPFRWETADEPSPVRIPLTCSIGVAISQEHGKRVEALIEAADGAMYHAKQGGRNRVCVVGEELAFIREMLGTTVDQQAQDRVALEVLVAMTNAYDKEMSAHAQRMVKLVDATAQVLGCAEEERHLLQLATLLHDIGKVAIPQDILHKPGPLSEDEWKVMRRHPSIGRQILALAGKKGALLSHIVVAHHERWDGHGYPYGLSQEIIPLGARILTVVDSYDAMISDRPYRKALPLAEVRAELQRCAGSQFDPAVVSAFMRVLDEQEGLGMMEKRVPSIFILGS